MSSNRRDKSAGHELHVCMSQVQKCFCIVDGLVISTLAELLHLVSSMQSALLSRHIIDVFQMTGLLRRTFFFNQRETKYLSIYLNEDLKPQVKTGTSSGNVVLNEMQWFIQVTFNSNIPKNEVHELGDPLHTLSLYCGRYIRITSENNQVYLSN